MGLLKQLKVTHANLKKNEIPDKILNGQLKIDKTFPAMYLSMLPVH